MFFAEEAHWLLVGGETFLAILLFLLVQKGYQALRNYYFVKKAPRVYPLRFRTLELLSAKRINQLVAGFLRTLRLILSVTLIYLYFTLLFSLFPATRGWADRLLHSVLVPLTHLLNLILAAIPNCIIVGLILLAARFCLKGFKFLAKEVEDGRIQFKQFYPEWAQPTYKLARIVLIAITLAALFPYIPGSNSLAFRGISVFFGLLFSLGSSSAVGNIVAGTVLTYMRPFRVGDHVRISDTEGDVLEKTLLVTRIRSIKNVEITIPNSMVLGHHLVNFSACTEDPTKPLILHTQLTLGYEVPWRTVHQVMIQAAKATPGILQEPSPYVFQKSLNDFYVTYEINAYTRKPNDMVKIYSELHASIMDHFYKAGIELMAPHYAAVREGSPSTIPPMYRSDSGADAKTQINSGKQGQNQPRPKVVSQ